MTDGARAIFDSIQTEQDVNSLIARGVNEGLHLEYKRVAQPLARADRENLAKVCCAFANSDGGVIVLGIETGNGHEKDLPVGEAPIAFPSQMVEELRREFGLWLSPVPKIQYRSIGEVSGFVVVLVPASDRPPHMDTLDHRYYQRHGSSSLPMEHYQLMDLIGRRRQPVPKIEITAGPNPRDYTYPNASNSKQVEMRFMLRNVGAAPMREVMVMVDFICEEGTLIALRPSTRSIWSPLHCTEQHYHFSRIWKGLIYPSLPGREFTCDLDSFLLVCSDDVHRFTVEWRVFADEMETHQDSAVWDWSTGDFVPYQAD